MNALDTMCLWLGRVWSIAALVMVALIAAAVVSEWRRARRDTRKVERVARLTAEVLSEARFVAACGHAACQAAAEQFGEGLRLEAAFRAPASKRGAA